MESFQQALHLHDVHIPDALIAQAPVSPRDSAALLVHNRKTGKTDWTVFRDVGAFLPPRSVLVLNDTKVIPAKLVLTRKSGGQVSMLVLGTEGTRITVMANRKFTKGEEIAIGGDRLTVVEQRERFWLLQPSFPIDQLPAMLNVHGTMPLPPYIKHSPLTRDALREEYQTVFAREEGSVAAPTASLHFTPELLQSLEQTGVRMVRLTLHVHLGTFAPLTEEQWNTGRLHTEYYHVDPAACAALETAKQAGDPIIAVGTTVVRTLESASDASGKIVRPVGETDLFIREGYAFKMVDGLITNFHVPRSSLLMLVCAFAGRDRVIGLYEQAVEKRLRFFSFGDAMLLL